MAWGTKFRGNFDESEERVNETLQFEIFKKSIFFVLYQIVVRSLRYKVEKPLELLAFKTTYSGV